VVQKTRHIDQQAQGTIFSF